MQAGYWYLDFTSAHSRAEKEGELIVFAISPRRAQSQTAQIRTSADWP
jgi:hypothetical protein